jgi:hypothetical protein
MRARSLAVLAGLALCFSLAPVPAGADHTNPRTPLSPTGSNPGVGAITRGAGTWTFIKNFQANPGTDLKFFGADGDIYASSGTLGGGNEGHVGQRIIRLTEDGVVSPQWVADHGSAKCNPATGVTGLQHDIATPGYSRPKLLIDTTDAAGRCHDPSGGGLEFIDVRRIHDAAFLPREVHLTRHAGTSHTVTVDATRPWIVYNSNSDFSGRNWVDVLDIRTCLGGDRLTLAQMRERCRPPVYRINFEDTWTQQRDQTTGQLEPGSAACHDITAKPGRIYCAAIRATLILDVRNLTDGNGNVQGTPLPCTLIDGTNTTAKVTDCSANGPDAPQEATGWVFLGTFNHAGVDCAVPGVTTCNSNLVAPSDQDIAISHEADVLDTGGFMGVTDERGGGVVPPGASCEPGVDNPYGNGGMHVFNISNPANIQYALTPSGEKAVFRGEIVVPAQTFCDIHVMEPINKEQRFVTAYYSQGTKIVDYRVDRQGRWTFIERASITLPGANTWTVQHFKTVNNPDGTVTYYFMASDIQRGIDIFSWTGPASTKVGTRVPATQTSGVAGNVALIALGAVLLPLAARLGRRRRATVA